jgi:hypothetical protein
MENLDGSMPAHMKGLEGNLLVQTQIQSMRMPGPLTGALDEPAADHPFAISSLALVTLGGSDPSNGFCL